MNYLLVYIALGVAFVGLLAWQLYKYLSVRKQMRRRFERTFNEKTIELKHYTKQLESYKNELEQMVKSRTEEIEYLNQELTASNEELLSMNENLEQKIRERTSTIERHKKQLMDYAFITSHELRAPLARILGLIHIIEIEDFDSSSMPMLLKRLKAEGNGLDQVIKEMNQRLDDHLEDEDGDF